MSGSRRGAVMTKLVLIATDGGQEPGEIDADRFERTGPTTAQLGLVGRVQLLAMLGANARMRRFDLSAEGETLRGCMIGAIGGSNSHGGGCTIEFQQVTLAQREHGHGVS